jgi:histidine triad (HIT) family protein
MTQAASDCIFCKIIAGSIPCFKLYEDAKTLAFLDINPVNPGHALVVPKAHAPTLMTSADGDLTPLLPVARRIAAAIETALKPDGINLLQSNGPGAAQSVMHLHLHVIPRRHGDELLMNWTLKPGDKEALAATAEQIKTALG